MCLDGQSSRVLCRKTVSNGAGRSSRTMRLPLLSVVATFAFAGAVFAQAPAVPAGQSHFNIVQASDGKTVGSADCSVATAAGGYQITSHGELKMPKFTYAFTNEDRLDSNLNVVHDQLTGTVNGAQVTCRLASDAAG